MIYHNLSVSAAYDEPPPKYMIFKAAGVVDVYTGADIPPDEQDVSYDQTYSLASTNDLASATVSSKSVVVADANTGGIFSWSATGAANGGTSYAGVTGFWNRLYARVPTFEMFGAIGDGIANDSVAIQNAVNSCPEVNGTFGKIYRVKNINPQKGISIDLCGSTLKLIDTTAAGSACIIFDSATNPVVPKNNFRLRNGILDGNISGAFVDNNVMGGVWLSNWDGVFIEDIKCINMQRVGLNVVGSRNVHFKNYEMADSGVDGVRYAYGLSIESSDGKRFYPSTNCSINNFKINNTIGFGAHIYNVNGITVDGVEILNLTYPLAIGITLTNVSNIKISTLIVNGSNVGIEINGTSNFSIDTFHIYNCSNRSLLFGDNGSGVNNTNGSIKNGEVELSLVMLTLNFVEDVTFEDVSFDVDAFESEYGTGRIARIQFNNCSIKSSVFSSFIASILNNVNVSCYNLRAGVISIDKSNGCTTIRLKKSFDASEVYTFNTSLFSYLIFGGVIELYTVYLSASSQNSITQLLFTSNGTTLNPTETHALAGSLSRKSSVTSTATNNLTITGNAIGTDVSAIIYGYGGGRS